MDPSTYSGPKCERPVMPLPSSTKPPYHVLPLLPTDTPRCVDIYFAATQDPQLVSPWPRSVPSDRQWWESALTTELSQPGAHWLKAVLVNEDDKSNADGSPIAAFAKWQEYPTGQKLSKTTTPSLTWPSGADAALCDETLAAWTRAHSETVGAKAHWSLEILATDPTCQGGDEGSSLAAQQIVQWGLERADIAGVDVYVKAPPAAVLLFGRFGFWEMGKREKWAAKDGSEVSAVEGEGEGEWHRDVYMLRYAAGCCA